MNQLAVRLGRISRAGAPFYGRQAGRRRRAEDQGAADAALRRRTIRASTPGSPAYEEALKANNKKYQIFTYENTQHGFHNDTTPRYNEAAAKLAWQRTVEFFNKNLRTT